MEGIEVTIKEAGGQGADPVKGHMKEGNLLSLQLENIVIEGQNPLQDPLTMYQTLKEI